MINFYTLFLDHNHIHWIFNFYIFALTLNFWWVLISKLSIHSLLLVKSYELLGRTKGKFLKNIIKTPIFKVFKKKLRMILKILEIRRSHLFSKNTSIFEDQVFEGQIFRREYFLKIRFFEEQTFEKSEIFKNFDI